MNDDAVSFDAGGEGRLALRELGVQTEHITVVADASKG
jgi:hypothetical protein